MQGSAGQQRFEMHLRYPVFTQKKITQKTEKKKAPLAGFLAVLRGFCLRQFSEEVRAIQ